MNVRGMFFRWLFGFVAIFNLSCTRSMSEPSKISIRLPGTAPASVSSKSVSTLSGPNWNAAVPSSIGEVGCYGVFVGGPEPEMSAGSCKNAEGSTIATFGRMRAFVPAGGTIELEVPSGSRKIYLFGSKLVSGSCVDIFNGTQPPFANYSNPYLLGTVEATLQAGPQEVTINAVGDFVAAKKIDDCTFAAKGAANVYGTGLDGDVTIDNDLNYYSNSSVYVDGSSRTRVFNASRRLKAIGPLDKHLIELHTSYSSTGTIDYAVGDEIMWWVVGARGGSPDSACVTDGSASAARGRYGFARVIGTPDGTHLRLDRVIVNNVDNLKLVGSPSGAGAFCAIQIVRVPNFDTLNVAPTAGVFFKPTMFDSNTSVGGIVAFRVKSTLHFPGNFSVQFLANDAGYEAGTTTGASGNSSLGINQSPSPAGKGHSTNGGGGGANAGAGGDGNTHAGSGGTANLLCAGNACDPSQRLFMGAGGGASAANSGRPGGGVIFVMAKNVTKANSGPWPYVQSDGAASGGNGGGGAGGTIYWKSDSIGVDFSSLQANGGPGGASSGGGGGGGLVKMEYCSYTGTVPTASVTAGSGYASGSAGMSGVAGGVCAP